MSSTQWMIYGANGYTGELIAREAVKRGLTPILAGRSIEKIRPLANELGLECRSFSLDQIKADALGDVGLVLHCAGPFSATAEPMMQACLRYGCHYLDITGEVAVFERAAALNDRARTAGIVLIPGVGFDVIPTDCLAARLKHALPDANHLALGFDSRSGFSPGTAKTSVEALPQGSLVRRDGKLKPTPLAAYTRTIAFGQEPKMAVAIPWGDVSTAWHSTGIDNIEVYIPMSPRKIAQLKRMNLFRGVLGWSWVQRLIKGRIERELKGPSDDQRQRHTTWVWGEVRNAKGEYVEGRVHTANGYDVTVSGALAVTEHLLSQPDASGYHTPSTLMGWALVEQLPGSGSIELCPRDEARQPAA
ncbi:saccharopine dehydrogenase NADP-binding domain-containing protein [Ferrimonas sp. YFM]|uniref:saccharopine dehydrogenase family protein n=1 Tax=Ferrimonas sp. YFM TaxID=3028878 RepID=UPI002574033D|nr:saccharopine dehydrogenase NADP-binding domain-containing protein [Ferrimonas sp. YFM]BDY04542.1 membrane protein [Ferrimonas sp. YFM]